MIYRLILFLALAMTSVFSADGEGVTNARNTTTGGNTQVFTAVFYPERWGAVANDTTDDRAAIQAAIDAAYTAGGGVVMLGKGTYYANEYSSGDCLYLKTGVLLKGQGLRATTLTTNPRLAGAFYNLVSPFGYDTATTPYGAHEMLIEDITFTATSYANQAAMTANSATYASGAETLLTINTTADVIIGDTVTISGSGDATYNATWTVTAVPSATTLAINKAWGSATATGGLSFPKTQTLHNFLGICHCPRAVIRRCGFDKAPIHYGEINSSKNVLIEDCVVIGTGNCGGSMWQLDDNGAAGIISGNARTSSTISNAATYASGTQTLLTMTSTAGFTAGSRVIITGANGASAANYNAVGGFRVLNVVSSTTLAIDLAWPGNATTAGTIRQTTPVQNVTIRRFDQSIGRADKGMDVAGGYDFMHLSHSTLTGVYQNITIEDCLIYVHDSTAPIAASRICIGWDTGAYPLECNGLYLRRNRFVGGGQSSISALFWLQTGYNASYARHYSEIVVEDNVAENTAMAHFLHIGDKTSGSDNSARTSINLAHIEQWKNYSVIGNRVEPVWRTGGSTFNRVTRCFNLGAAERATVRNNRVRWVNVAPILNPTAFTAGSGNLGFMVDHPRDLIFEGNEVECQLRNENVALWSHAFVFGCSAYEISSGNAYKGHWHWVNNAAIGTGSVGAGISNGFVELLTAGTTGMSSWISTTTPNITGTWRGNRVVTGGSLPAHTVGGSAYLAVPNNTSLTTAAIAPAFAEAPSGTNPGRHRWGYGPRTGTATLVGGTVTVADVLITANTNIQVTRSTAGGTTGHYTVTRNVGQDFTITSSSGTDTSVVSYTITEPN